MHITKILSFITTVSLLFLSCIKEEASNDMVINHVNANDQVPTFAVEGPDDISFSSKQFVGKQSLLIFFGTYCSDCKKVLPVIEEVWKELKNDKKFLLVPIARKESVEDITKYWTDNQYTMPFYLDPEGSVFALFANNTIPRIYIINPDNVVTWMSVESLDLTAKELIKRIKGGK